MSPPRARAGERQRGRHAAPDPAETAPIEAVPERGHAEPDSAETAVIERITEPEPAEEQAAEDQAGEEQAVEEPVRPESTSSEAASIGAVSAEPASAEPASPELASPEPASAEPESAESARRYRMPGWLRRRVTPVADKKRVAFIDIMRAIAAILIVYSHLEWVFLHGRGLHLGLLDWLDHWLFIPLGFGDQGPGGISVPAFFLTSGLVVTPIAIRMGGARFAVNRFFRIYPLFIAAFVLALVAVFLGFSPLVTGNPEPVTPSKVFANLFFYNFTLKPLDSYVAVAWTLFIEVLFYILLVLLTPLFRRSPLLALLVEFNLVVAVFLTHDLFGRQYAAFASLFAYLLVPIMGQVIWAAWQRKIPMAAAGVFLLFGWLLFLWAARAHFDEAYILRPFPIAVAVVLFVLGLLAEKHLRERPIWTALSERTYAIYLLHGVVLFPVLTALYTQLPLGLAVVLALLATALVVELTYRFVERPLHQFGRRLAKRDWSGLTRRRAGASARSGR
ncbi:acyltransferase family protein [Sciscionella sediminilitoris]|uniref:acyltransferase family protein n=1 Tax=Sciscionella sediminilitoris TaxID=1445613 RepID=UPI0012E26F14|nr:acyltransferase [Sciscionella sp. SE31]